VLHVGSWQDAEAALLLLRCCYTGRLDAAAPGAPDVDALLTSQAAALRAAAVAQHQARSGACGAPQQAGCWQQLAVRTLVLADRLDCAAVVESCVEALSGRLFAHQMSLDAAMAVLWLLPETLARQVVVAPLQHMAHVRVVQVGGRPAPGWSRATARPRQQCLGTRCHPIVCTPWPPDPRPHTAHRLFVPLRSLVTLRRRWATPSAPRHCRACRPRRW
jgi:hypothetical protein